MKYVFEYKIDSQGLIRNKRAKIKADTVDIVKEFNTKKELLKYLQNNRKFIVSYYRLE